MNEYQKRHYEINMEIQKLSTKIPLEYQEILSEIERLHQEREKISKNEVIRIFSE